MNAEKKCAIQARIVAIFSIMLIVVGGFLTFGSLPFEQSEQAQRVKRVVSAWRAKIELAESKLAKLELAKAELAKDESANIDVPLFNRAELNAAKITDAEIKIGMLRLHESDVLAKLARARSDDDRRRELAFIPQDNQGWRCCGILMLIFGVGGAYFLLFDRCPGCGKACTMKATGKQRQDGGESRKRLEYRCELCGCLKWEKEPDEAC